ncbi:hypothetical protein K7432_010779 [Basidiobolus ranarum]|uniref:Serine/threonine-protein kinase 11-interacting protein n=1 Tax=Basidiobolus ranarum TaxID=34480 RepID=A0ABR2WNA7_9FUNG
MNSPEEIVLACAKYLRTNEKYFRIKGKPTDEEDGDPTLFSSLTSAFTLGYVRPVNNPKERTCTVDPVKLGIILEKFEEYGLLTQGLPQFTPVSPAQSTHSVSSFASIASNFSNLSFLGWKKKEYTGLDAKLHFQTELEYVYQFFQKIPRLQIRRVDSNPNIQLELPTPISLGIFVNLVHLDLQKLPPRYFSNWNVVHSNLMSISCQGGIVDLYDLFVDTIGRDISVETNSSWPNLRSIDLSHNDLSGLTVEPILRITACESLNLSHNLLLSVPPALTELFRLKSLNLSHNMISNVSGIDHILGNISVLDLSHNKLKSLCGLQKLWSLMFINVRGNDIADIGEVGRLAELPSIQEIYVEGNPLTQKTDYRIQLFSIFLANELHILLDGTGPSFLENRNILTKSKVEPELESVIAVRVPTKYTRVSDSISEKTETDEIPTLKTRRNRPVVPKNRRKGKRVVDISSDRDSLDSILESPRFLNSPLPGRNTELMLTDEPDELECDHISQHGSFIDGSTLGKLSQSQPTSPTKQVKPFVHRLAELEGTIQTGRSELHIPTRGRHFQRDSQPSSPRSRSPASIRSSMSILTATNYNEDFRKKIEALRNEAGSTWLKIYSEIQHPTNATKRQTTPDSLVSNEDKFIAGTLPSKLTLVSSHTPVSNPNESISANEIEEEDVQSSNGSSSLKSKKSDAMMDVIPPTIVEFTPSDEVAKEPEPEVEVKKLPDGKQYRIKVIEYSSRVRSKRFIRVPAGDRILIISKSSFVEADPETWDIICQRGFQGLLRIESKQVGKVEQHLVFRLEFKYRRYDNPIFCDYQVIGDCGDAEKTLKSELEAIVKKNWEEGKGHEVYKQGKCLNCSWIGFLNLEDCQDRGGWLGIKKLNIGLSPATSESESDAKEKERKCPVCSGTFLVEFFGREEHEITQSSEAPIWAFTSSSNVANSDSPASNKAGFFDSWLTNPLVGLTNRSDTKSSVKSPESLTSTPEEKVLEKKSVEVLEKMEKVTGYSASLPPYRNISNAIRLYFQLSIIEEDTEKLITWIPSAYIPHAPTSVALPSMWSIMTSNNENVPKNSPTEKPIYIGLTNRSMYLFLPLNIPLPNSTSSVENNPGKHLKLLHAIPISLITRIDVGPNRQTLTIHLSLTSSDGNSSPIASLALPPHSITFLIRDRLICSDFLNALVEICYDHDIHVEEGKVKLVNHDIEWAVKNIRRQVLIDEVNYKLEKLPNHHLIGVDPASSQEVVVDKVTFDFFKIYHLVTRLIEQPSSPVTNTDPSYYDIEAFTMVGTEKYLYLCQERHDVWPPAITNISEIMDTPQNSSTTRKAEGRWGRKKTHPLMATLVEQYKRVEVLPVSWITEVERIKKGMNMIIGKEKEGVNVGCSATGWEVLIRITFEEQKQPSNPKLDSSLESTTTLQNSPSLIEESKNEPSPEETELTTKAEVQQPDLDLTLDCDNSHEESVTQSESTPENPKSSEEHAEHESKNDGEGDLDDITDVSQDKQLEHNPIEDQAANANQQISWCLLFPTQTSADEFIENLGDIWKKSMGTSLNLLE